MSRVKERLEAVLSSFSHYSSPPSSGIGIRVARIAQTMPQGMQRRQSKATASWASMVSAMVMLCHHMAVTTMAATTVDTFAPNRARPMRRGAQLHLVHCHARERARERRRLTGVEYWAWVSRDGPVRITSGRVDGLPETLKRMDVCITSTLWIVAFGRQKTAAISVATIHNVSPRRAILRISEWQP